jgi:hypothetical protein
MSTGSRPPVGARSPDAAINSNTCSPRALSLAESGLLDVAAGISNVARSLTDSAIASIETRMSERDRRAPRDEVEFLRTAIFNGIAQNIIERVEQRLKPDPQN